MAIEETGTTLRVQARGRIAKTANTKDTLNSIVHFSAIALHHQFPPEIAIIFSKVKAG